MAEYIKREEAEDAAIRTVYQVEGGASVILDDEMHRAMSEIPAANVVEVRHGEWEKDPIAIRDDGEIYDYRCSVCKGKAHKGDYGNYNVFADFCHHCGAKMDGKVIQMAKNERISLEEAVGRLYKRETAQISLEKAIELLKKEYEKAEGMDFIYNPIAYALYQVWKMADERKG